MIQPDDPQLVGIFNDSTLEQAELRNLKFVTEYLAGFQMPTVTTVPFELDNMSFGEIGMRGISNVWLRQDGGEGGIWEARMSFDIFGGTGHDEKHGHEPFHELCFENTVMGRAISPLVAIMAMYHNCKSIGASLWI